MGVFQGALIGQTRVDDKKPTPTPLPYRIPLCGADDVDVFWTGRGEGERPLQTRRRLKMRTINK